MNKVFNIIPSPIDVRDHLFQNVYPNTQFPNEIVNSNNSKIPIELDLRPGLLEIRDQENTPYCGAFSAACMKEYQDKLEIKLQSYLSVQWIYYQRENKESDGMYIRDILKILQHKGVPREKHWQFKKEKPEDVWGIVCEEALNHKIKNYLKCETIEDVKNALFLCGPCIFRVGYYKNSHKIEFWKPVANDIPEGGHAMVIVGYDKKSFIVRNSWGKKWNKTGYCNIPFEDFQWMYEIYASYDDISTKKYNYEFLPNIPNLPNINIIKNLSERKKECCNVL